MKVLIILGPTASGKTNTAFELAKAINGEIISADSIQVYKFFDVGSAKPSKKQMEVVPHHLIDIKYPNEEFSAIDFAKAAKNLIEIIQEKGKIPILTGGTLFYIDALLNGLDAIPQINPKIKNFFNDISDEKIINLYNWVNIIDPKWAKKINKHDVNRINRALSVYLQTGKVLTSFFVSKKKDHFFNNELIFSLQINDEELRKRIKTRTISMINGLIDETKKLIEMGYATAKPLQSIGYRQACQYLSGKISENELIESIIRETLLYAKRQKTYFNSKFRDRSIPINYRNATKLILEYLSQTHFS